LEVVHGERVDIQMSNLVSNAGEGNLHLTIATRVLHHNLPRKTNFLCGESAEKFKYSVHIAKIFLQSVKVNSHSLMVSSSSYADSKP
jgi:hypothetical protein